MARIERTASWERPITTKRYLQPPLAHNIVTLWPDFKIMLSEVTTDSHGRSISSAFRLLVGAEQAQIDFEKTKSVINEDGAPVLALEQCFGDFTLYMEAFCDTEKFPTAFCKITIKNNTLWEVSDEITIIPRTGREDHLTGSEVDGYCTLDTNIHSWGMLPSGWKWDGQGLSDGKYNIAVCASGGISPVWQGEQPGLVMYRRNTLRMPFTVPVSGSVTVTLRFRQGAASSADYDAQKSATETFWMKELSRIRSNPKSGGTAMRTAYRTLVGQLLQMFATRIDTGEVIPRQGCLQRLVWPVEAMEFLIALDRIGDFYEYTDTAYDLFFGSFQVADGDDAGAVVNSRGGQPWGSITGGSVYGLAEHMARAADSGTYEKYADRAYAAFRWMERQREKTRGGEFAGVGIFPPMKVSDWPGQYQGWCITDSCNLMGYRSLAAVFEKYGDPRTGEIRAAYDDYMKCMAAILDAEVAKNTRSDEIIITNKVGVEPTDPPLGPYFSDGPATLLRAGVIDPNSETAHLVESYFRNRNAMKNGLTGLMNDGLLFQGHNSDPWAGHTWYTSYSDLCWLYCWLEQGETEKARETLVAQLKYGMTPEFNMMERYADNDPAWVPWLPNASANGRFIMMLLDYEERVGEL